MGYINAHGSSTQLGDKYETEAITMMSLLNGVLTPTINYTPDPELDLDYVPNEARECDVNIALTNAFAFGGCNATLVVRKYAEGRQA
mgnify:FL=1